jgi:hypothetical protein
MWKKAFIGYNLFLLIVFSSIAFLFSDHAPKPTPEKIIPSNFKIDSNSALINNSTYNDDDDQNPYMLSDDNDCDRIQCANSNDA